MKSCKILHVVGARPQFIKMALVVKAAGSFGSVSSVIAHTGQHYDGNMSDIFFRQLNIPRPKYNLNVGSGPHSEQIGKMIIGLGRIIAREAPDMVFVYGDTNSTLAGAIAAVKEGAKLAHVEAGLRSFNRSMPEEINRVMTDAISDILFCPTKTAVDNLRAEGITQGVHKVEDVMLEMLIKYSKLATERSGILEELGVGSRDYYLATVHRSYNTDDTRRLARIMRALGRLDKRVIFPVHPRTRKALNDLGIRCGGNISMVDPVPYLDMLMLEMNAKAILTDSGGVQKEVFFLKVPCVTLREETEWVETVKSGWNIVTGADGARIKSALRKLANIRKPKAKHAKASAAKKMIEIALRSMK